MTKPFTEYTDPELVAAWYSYEDMATDLSATDDEAVVKLEAEMARRSGGTPWSDFCCEKFAKEATGHESFAAGGFMYPPEMRPAKQIEQDPDGRWNVNGCCGGCCVITGMRFCPFCGTPLPLQACRSSAD